MLARMGDWAIAVELDDDDDPVNPASGVDWRGSDNDCFIVIA